MPFDGILIIDKPLGITSRDAVNRVQTWFPRGTRIGHTGTLDPLATGVLVVCVGVATRLTEYIQDMTKVYRAGITFGATSDTDDVDGTVTPTPRVSAPSRENVTQALAGFLGTIEQTPPAYSAAKVAGRRAYDLARKGKVFDLQPRSVTIYRIDILRYEYPHLEIEVECGKGTYIRSLARDLGVRLDCGGYITALRRLRVGCFRAEDALPSDVERAVARERLLPIALAVSDLPRLTFPAADAARLRQGQSVAFPASANATANEGAVFDETGRLIAVVVVDTEKSLVRPDKVFFGGDSALSPGGERGANAAHNHPDTHNTATKNAAGTHGTAASASQRTVADG